MNIFNLFKHETKPYNTGYLPECDGHQIYYQQIGNPSGEIVLSFHGGPGGAARPTHADIFDLKKYRVIIFDQRGCGKSLLKNPFYKNTLPETINDAARLLAHLNIRGKITLRGSSFGTTCALLFAETFPDRVKKMVLISTFLARPKDADIATRPLFYPDVMDLFQKQAGRRSIFDYYYKLAFSDKRTDRLRALRYYGSFERKLGKTSVDFPVIQATDRDILSMQIALDYEKHHFYLRNNQLMKNIGTIKHIPCFIYQNRLDFCCPPYQAFELHKQLPKSKLTIFSDKGHGSFRLTQYIKKDLK